MAPLIFWKPLAPQTLGYLTVASVGPFTCVLQVPPNTKHFRVPALFYCLLEHRASQKIALYIAEIGLGWRPYFPPEQHDQLSITIVGDVQFLRPPADCDWWKRLYFDRHNVLVTPHHIDARVSHTIDIDDLPALRNVVKSSLHFYHHLTRPGK